VNTYSVSYTSAGTDITATVVANGFTFNVGFVLFESNSAVVFAVPTDRQPVITLTQAGSQ
jgi:hypothetical protein